MKSYTDLEQSKRLTEILSIETADMYYKYILPKSDKIHHIPEIGNPINSLKWYNEGYTFSGKRKPITLNDYCIPCWSLAALSEFILPYIVDDDGNNYKFYLSKDGLDRWIAYYKSDDVSIHICEESDNMIDVILEMVCWLKNEEYI
jgi:hypothetical protein